MANFLLPLEISAETHCSVLTKKGTVFEKCHGVVNPIPFYKVGNYDRRCTEQDPVRTSTYLHTVSHSFGAAIHRS